MDSIRQKKISNLIKEAFGEIIIKEGPNYFGKAFVTITNVKVTPDMSIARIYLSVFNIEEPQTLIDEMNFASGEFRRLLGNKMRHDLRKIPELEFFLDDTLDQVEKIEKLFDNIKKKDNKDEA